MTQETRDDLDRKLSNMRLAAAVNMVLLAMRHAGRETFTDRDAQSLRILVTASDDCMAHGVNGVTPSGFEIVASHQSSALEAVSRALEQRPEPQKTGAVFMDPDTGEAIPVNGDLLKRLRAGSAVEHGETA